MLSVFAFWTAVSPQDTFSAPLAHPQKFNAQYYQTTGMPGNGNEWRKFRVVPCLHPLASPCFSTLFHRGGNTSACRLPGEGGDHCHCTLGTFAQSYSVSTNAVVGVASCRLQNACLSVSSKPTSEFAQPRLSRVKRRSSPTTGYKFGCVCSHMAGHWIAASS